MLLYEPATSAVMVQLCMSSYQRSASWEYSYTAISLQCYVLFAFAAHRVVNTQAAELSRLPYSLRCPYMSRSQSQAVCSATHCVHMCRTLEREVRAHDRKLHLKLCNKCFAFQSNLPERVGVMHDNMRIPTAIDNTIG